MTFLKKRIHPFGWPVLSFTGWHYIGPSVKTSLTIEFQPICSRCFPDLLSLHPCLPHFEFGCFPFSFIFPLCHGMIILHFYSSIWCELVFGQGHTEEPEPRYYIRRLPHLSTCKSNGINEEKQANIPLKECLPVFAITMSA